MYKVVEFENSDGDGGGISVVRTKCLTPLKRECLWPPVKLMAKFNKYLSNGTLPDENWPIHCIKRVFYETDDIMKVRQKCKRAESESELLSEFEEEENKRKRKRKIINDSSEDSDQEWEDRTKIKYPIPPKKLSCIKDPLSESRVATPRLSQEYNFDSPVSSHSVAEELDAPTSSYLSSTKKVLQLKLIQNPSLDKISATVLDVIATHLGDIKSEIKELRQTQNDILLKVSASISAFPVSLPENITIPLNELQDLNNLESWLEDKENKETLINYLSYIGGNKTAVITRRVLDRVFTNSFAVKCNWSGKNNKHSLRDLHVK